MAAKGSKWKPATAGTKFKYKCMLLNGLENFVDPAIVPLSERTDLPPEAKALLFTIDTLPKKGGLTSSRWYTPPSPPPTPTKNVIGLPASLDPTATTFLPMEMSHVTDMKPLEFTATSRGLTTSRWAQPACNVLAVNKEPMIELDPAEPIKARDIPVHMRGYYIPPNQRPPGLKAVPGKPILPYIEPHQRVGILPEVIPNDTEYPTSSFKTLHPMSGDYSVSKPSYSIFTDQQIPETSALTGLENNSIGDLKPCVPYLASTFEEFIGGKDVIATVKQLQPASTNITKPITPRKIQLPPDCFSPTLDPGRDRQKLEAKVLANENMKPGIPWPVREILTLSPGEEIQAAVVGQATKGKHTELVEPKVYSTAELPPVNIRVQQTKQEFAKDISDTIIFEIRNPQPAIMDLTHDALVEKTGGAPKDTSSSGVGQFVSDDGIEVGHDSDEQNSSNDVTAPVDDSRTYLAKCDDTLQQADGSWMPVPFSWEDERSTFHNAFIPQFIATWAKTVPKITGKVDTDRDEFKSGLSALSQFSFEEPMSQPLCYPDVEHSDNAAKQVVQTAEIDCRAFAARILKRHRALERQAKIAAQQEFHYQEEIMVNPNIPKIDIYLRPAQMKDVPGITSLYNHYVLNSIITEDQSSVSEQHIQNTLEDAHENNLPFIVAIKGRVPPRGSANTDEFVLGFAFTEFLNYGLCGTHLGASRFTGIIQLYVEPNHTRKGVGRSLLDRILVCSSTTHASKEGYHWTCPNAREATVYGQPGGAQKFHQLLFRRAIEVKGDLDYEWLKQWLFSKFFIEEAARLKSVARSTNVGTTTRWLDVAIFQFEAAHESGFDITF